jgi:uncharacterized protein YcaQ
MQPEGRDSPYRAVDRKRISTSLKNLVSSGKVVEIQIREIPELKYYALSKIIQKDGETRNGKSALFLLSPFDNLIIQRERIKTLFGFNYSLECYTPAAKRKFGYYVLPILWGNRFVGRLDPKADRKKKILNILNLVFEPEFCKFVEFLPLLSQKLIDLARFNNCQKIEVEKVTPAKIKIDLKKYLKSM